MWPPFFVVQCRAICAADWTHYHVYSRGKEKYQRINDTLAHYSDTRPKIVRAHGNLSYS
jgi:hypothetical protein